MLAQVAELGCGLGQLKQVLVDFLVLFLAVEVEGVVFFLEKVEGDAVFELCVEGDVHRSVEVNLLEALLDGFLLHLLQQHFVALLFLLHQRIESFGHLFFLQRRIEGK